MDPATRSSLAPARDATMTADGRHPPPAALEREAWVWLRRFHAGDVRPWDAQAFKRWVATSPAHQQAFSMARRDWALLHPAAGEALRGKPLAAARDRAASHGPGRNRRAFLGAAVSAAGVAGVALALPDLDLWASPANWGADERTATGEQRVLALGARIHVTLNTQTRVRRQMAGDDIVGMDLLSGEAAIDLAASGQAFVVVAGAGRSTAQASRFEVRHLDGRTCVTCIEGQVQVQHPAGVRQLLARQQLVYDGTGLGAVTGGLATATSAWRKGALVFDQTPLAQVVDEINRYRPGRVVLMNAQAGRQPVSGSFDIALLDLALAQLERTFSLRSRALPAGLYVLS